MTRHNAIGIVACLLAAAASGAGQPDEAPLAALAEVMPGLESRLAQLTRANPDAYFLLGEEVASEASSQFHRQLARELYVRAFVYSGDDPGFATLRASVAFAIAELEDRDRIRAWLLAVARTAVPVYSRPDWSRAVETPVNETAGLEAAEAVGAVRSGDRGLAGNLLDDEDVRQLLRTYGGLLTGTAGEDALPLLEQELRRQPCPECRNDRISSTRGDEPVERLCLTCLGNPGWPLSPEQLVGTLRFESFLLSGVQRSWAAQYAADEAAPLQDPDPAQLTDIYGVDPARSVWRDGAWKEPEG